MAAPILPVELADAMKPPFAVPGQAGPAAVNARLGDIRGEIDVGPFISRAQLIENVARTVFVEAAEHPVRAFHRLERLFRHQPDLQGAGAHIGIYLADQPPCQLAFRAPWHRIAMPAASE